MSTFIRPLVLQDYDQVLALWEQSPGIGLNDADTREKMAQYLARNPGLSHVAESNGTLVGAALCGHDGRRGYLNHLAISGRFQKAGLGRRLVAHCLDALQKAGISKCHLFVFSENREAQKFWQKTGWTRRHDLALFSRSTGDPG